MAHPRALYLANLLQVCIQKKPPHFNAESIIHAQILTNGFSSDTFLSNRLVEFYSKSSHLDHAIKVFDGMPHRNIYSWNAIISACSKSGNLDLACQLFDRMTERNVVSYNTVISAMAKGGMEERALKLYYRMVGEGILPTHFTFASVLSACGTLVGLVDGRRCHGLVVKIGLDENLFVENALLSMYTKCGSIQDAISVFDGMSQPNEVSFTAMMGGLMQSGSVDEALRLFGKMHRNGIRIDPVAVSSVLNVCARAEEDEWEDLDQNHGICGNLHRWSIQALITKYGFDSDTHVSNSLIDMYAKHGEMETAEMVFNTLSIVNSVSWNVLISGYGQMGNSNKAIHLLKQMKELGFESDEVTYISMLGACVKSGDIEAATQMFGNISNPTVTSWNAILSGYSQEESYGKAIQYFREMQFMNCKPDRTTAAVILSSCSGMGLLHFGKQVHAASVRAMLDVDMFVASGLVDMYSKCGFIEAARCVFDRMPNRDVVSWNSMITGFAHHSLNQEAFTFFKQMRPNGMSPTASSYASVVNSCARLSSLPQGRQIHAMILKDGYDDHVFVGSTLIDMYAKCGNVDEAWLFFDSMPVKNVVSWNEMIHGYAQNGLGEKAVELFEHMLSTAEKPDGVTFISVLTACSHAGLIDEGIKYFNSMEEHGIKPLADHYTCVIDSLGRAGRLMEAEVFVDKMPFKDDPIIWEVFLSACAVHGSARLGRKAAEQLFRLDPQNSAPYVLLSNIYAALGQWSDVSAVRALMTDRGIIKDRGYSWIYHKDGVTTFMVDDQGATNCKGDSFFDEVNPDHNLVLSNNGDEICAI
ncbi:hypothetical protein J5N97_009544 [Dioscorea zingiberensis]|uniref:Pentatricopeptide repeat-containing protein n=1 Tax=Dioscorea zingiberensis TaxID=325984 RepID=A0A9D5HLR4_9LILI|nr:hypothetical protein J5N97_009544 [Dioscorea zingiberensis]